MATINLSYTKLPANYLFADIAKKVSDFAHRNPDKHIIKLGIGDVTRPIPLPIVNAIKQATDEIGTAAGFKGYGPYEGYYFLREQISKNDYVKKGINISPDEIFISDGSKSDASCFGDIFEQNSKIAVCDPIYPVYADASVLNGRSGNLERDGRWSDIIYLEATEKNNFLPEISKEKTDLIYLCFPNNPTGKEATKEYLERWVDYATMYNSVILYDSAYEAYISDENIPHSIFEIKGAKKCAVEFRSFSKTAGFTGLRCAYTVVPKELVVSGVSVNSIWARHRAAKYNGTSYIVQKGAAAVYSDEGQQAVQENINYYMNNASAIKKSLEKTGLTVYGGVNAPYIWLKTPNGLSSWQFFEQLLNELYIVTTPGSGFGPAGEGFVRITAFGDVKESEEAVKRIAGRYGKS